MYSIIDIETTGGNPKKDKITEIAIYIHDGKRVVDEFQTLVNPERRIPQFITKMTGISDEMVAAAPRFWEIAKKVVEITEETIFVAHNVFFDYNFIKSEYRSLGFYYQRNVLCTEKLSRKILPGKKSYSLGKLCYELDIAIGSRHRAAGDALATVKLFETLLRNKPDNLSLENISNGINSNGLHPGLSKELIGELPHSTGIYYFLNNNNKIIYIGKSKDIRKRVLNHLSQIRSKKNKDMISQTAHIEFEETGSELIALLRESDEIKKHQPHFNVPRKNCHFAFGLYSYVSKEGYIAFKVSRQNSGPASITGFASEGKAKDFLMRIIDRYHLCQNFSGLFATKGACFQYAVGKCFGACTGKEKPEDYNQRALQAIEYAGFTEQNLVVLDEGRTVEETGFIIIESGKYLGYGFINKDKVICDPSDFKNFLILGNDNDETRQIISGYLRNKRTGKRISY